MANGYSCEHDDCIVVHENWECPLCLAETEIKDLKGTIKSMESKDE